MNLAEGDLADQDLVETVKELIRLESAVRAALSQAVAVLLSQGAYEPAGYATAADLLRSECHLSGREAKELVVSALRLRKHLHCTLLALQCGMITWAHATTLVRAVDRLGLDTVLGTEHDWIELIATRSGPEALQRVVHGRRLEQVGYPARQAPEPEVDETVFVPSTRSDASSAASTGSPTAAYTGDGSQPCGSADDEAGSQDPRQHALANEEQRVLGDSRDVQQPVRGAELSSDPGPTLERRATPTLTLSSDNASSSVGRSGTSRPGCAHPGCTREATLREISFTVQWLDGSRSEILGCGLLCEEHAVALVSCTITGIRVGHQTTIRTIGPALVPEAA
jgi:hypothetical protein